MTVFPSAVQYQAALQDPGRVFTHPGMQQARFARDSWGLPDLVKGSSAVVFKATIGADCYALRCYTREDASSKKRYEAFDRYVTGNRLTDHVATVTWFDDAVRVNGATWPVLRMEWIEGRILDQYVAYLVKNSDLAALAAVADLWRDLIRVLQDAQFAHGDLQHRNVIVDQKGSLRLVDFDGIWIPPLQGQRPPTESGHDNFQHPGRTPDAGWGRWVDTFSALVIYLSLVALATEPDLWALYNDDNLLFEQRDFYPPFETPTWTRLARVRDPRVQRLMGKLKECCAPGWVPAQSLETVLTPAWYELTGATPADGAARTASADGAARAPSAPVVTPSPAPPSPPPVWQYARSAGGQPGRLPPPPATASFKGVPASPWPAQPPPAPGSPAPVQASRTAAGSKPGGQPWWQQPGVTQAPPAKPPASSGRTAAGWTLIAVSWVLLIALSAAHLAGAGVLVALVTICTGVVLIARGRKNPPGAPPPGRT